MTSVPARPDKALATSPGHALWCVLDGDGHTPRGCMSRIFEGPGLPGLFVARTERGPRVVVDVKPTGGALVLTAEQVDVLSGILAEAKYLTDVDSLAAVTA